MSKYQILDACCGSRMFWFDRDHPNVVFADLRHEKHELCDGRDLEIRPTVQSDFRQMPFADESFALVIFDPPHLAQLGGSSWTAKKYGKLFSTWRDDLRAGFDECWRVLKPQGTLIFKWNEYDIAVSELLKIFPQQPLIGHRSGKQSKTHWLTFMKLPQMFVAPLVAPSGAAETVRRGGRETTRRRSPVSTPGASLIAPQPCAAEGGGSSATPTGVRFLD